MEDQLIVSRERRLGHIRLNRPKALNSLTLEMVRGFTQALARFAAEPEVAAVLVSGEGERGLCAGGDIRALYELRDGDKTYYKTFWREEYELNARIAAFPKPFVALMDGVVMGGGVGISAHGNRRIVTERTRLAMPETGIGFIPDVGGTWLLTRKNAGGAYMALSGETVGPDDALHVGLADMRIASSDIPRLFEDLTGISRPHDVDTILAALVAPPGRSVLAEHADELARAMTADTVAEILEALRACGTEFSRKAAADIAARSPTSLVVTHALLKRARAARSLPDCLLAEYRAACSLLDGHDLYEGIRAAIIDKDRAPKWRPVTLADVSDAVVAAILEGRGDPEPDFGFLASPLYSWRPHAR